MNEKQLIDLLMGENKRLEKRIEQLESDMILTKQHMIQAVQMMNDNFSRELNRILVDYEESLREATLQVIRDNK